MNDPHVAALNYWVEHDDSVDYDNAPPLDHEDDLVEAHLEKRQLTLRPKKHYATEQEARDELENFIRNWEFDATVESGSRQFRLNFQDADVIDRNPTPPPPGVVAVSARPVRFRLEISNPRGRVGKPSYPSPTEITRLDSGNPAALAMMSRLDRYHERRETLSAMCYFCLTVMWDSAKAATGTRDSRQAARNYYAIGNELQGKVSYLSTKKGADESRKYEGSQQEFSSEERRFLLAAVQAFTRRVAERAANPGVDLRPITLADLPQLPK